MAVKDLTFLQDTPFFNGGIFDNQQVYENTTNAIKNLVKAKCGLKTNLRMTQDNIVICFTDKDLMRLIHVEDNVKACTYENINYVSKFPILTLNELVEQTHDIPLICEMEKNNNIYKMRVMDVLSMYDGLYAIISNDIKTLRWLSKNYPNTIIGYKIDETNKHHLHLFKNYDFVCIDNNVYDDKQVRKLKESTIVIGCGIKDDNVFDLKKDVYDNLICEPQLEKNN